MISTVKAGDVLRMKRGSIKKTNRCNIAVDDLSGLKVRAIGETRHCPDGKDRVLCRAVHPDGKVAPDEMPLDVPVEDLRDRGLGNVISSVAGGIKAAFAGFGYGTLPNAVCRQRHRHTPECMGEAR